MELTQGVEGKGWGTENTEGTPKELLVMPKVWLTRHRKYVYLPSPPHFLHSHFTSTHSFNTFILLVNKSLSGMYYCGFFGGCWVARLHKTPGSCRALAVNLNHLPLPRCTSAKLAYPVGIFKPRPLNQQSLSRKFCKNNSKWFDSSSKS